jgi:ribosome biogenesis GTPase / thiamine phosphate phosphatase
MNLADLGWDEFFAQSFAAFAAEGLAPARVSMQHRGAYEVYSPDGEMIAEVSGRFRHQTSRSSEFPAVGDWVVIEEVERCSKAVIHAVLPRRTKLSRSAAGDPTEEQVLGANVDSVFIVEALTESLNVRRIERFLTLARESKASAVILLTKIDLCGEVGSAVADVHRVAGDSKVHALSGLTGQGVSAVKEHLIAGRTGALLGPSGVGKSTLINFLAGQEQQDVQPVRESDQKGRHTTTRRELICLPGGGLIIDTPGLRELQLWEGGEGLSESFEDVEALARNCRFTDCEHETEPDCAVREAIQSGLLDPLRLASHRKLEREVAWFARRLDARAEAEQRRKVKRLTRSLRAHHKNQNDPD